MDNRFQIGSDTVFAPARELRAITKSDVTDLFDSNLFFKALYVGTGGDVVVIAIDDIAPVTFKNVPSGTVLPVRPRKVMDATTAADIVGLA